MDSSSEEKALLRNNPFFVIGIASLIAITMFAVSFISYYNSDTKRTIEQIQANNLNGVTDTDQQFQTELNGTYIDDLEKTISDKVTSHVDDVEFSPDELTDSALGL